MLTVDNALHAAGGCAMFMLLLPALWSHWSGPVWVGILFALWGLIREKEQARSWDRVWLSDHKLAEGVAWGIGAGLACGLAEFWGWI